MTAPDPAVARRDAEEALAAWDDHDSYFRERGSKYEGASRACARSLAVALRALLAATEPAPAPPDEVREAAEMLRLTVGMREAKHACDDRACSNVALGALNLLSALAARGGRP